MLLIFTFSQLSLLIRQLGLDCLAVSNTLSTTLATPSSWLQSVASVPPAKGGGGGGGGAPGGSSGGGGGGRGGAPGKGGNGDCG